MNFRFSFLMSLFFSVSLIAAGCGGSGGGGDSDSGGGGSAEIDITDPSALSYDISNLDVSAQSGSSNISALVKRGIGGDLGDESIAGCQVNQMAGEAVRIAKQVDLINCYVSFMLNTTDEVIPDGEFAYFSVDMPAVEDSEGSFEILVRVGTFDGQFRMDACENDALSMELRTSLTDTTLAASVVNHFAQLDFDEWMGVSFNVELTAGATEMSIDTVSSADITAEFDGNFGLGMMDFTYDGTAGTNTVTGVHQGEFGEGDSFTGQIGGEWNATDGAARYSASGTFPGIPAEFLEFLNVPAGQIACPDFGDCDPEENFADSTCQVESPPVSCFCMELKDEEEGCTFTESGTEAFSIAYDVETEEKTFTLADTNDFVALVEALTLPSVEDISIAFVDNWDCTGTFTELSFTSPPTACMAMEEEVHGDGEGDRDSCFQDKGEGIAEEGEGEIM